MADANPLANRDDDIQLQTYQDDFDTKGKPDDITPAMTDDPVEELGIPASELRDELNNRAIGDTDSSSGNNESRFDEDDAREDIESRDADLGEEGNPDTN
jgi:hypothetical protein